MKSDLKLDGFELTKKFMKLKVYLKSQFHIKIRQIKEFQFYCFFDFPKKLSNRIISALVNYSFTKKKPFRFFQPRLLKFFHFCCRYTIRALQNTIYPDDLTKALMGQRLKKYVKNGSRSHHPNTSGSHRGSNWSRATSQTSAIR